MGRPVFLLSLTALFACGPSVDDEPPQDEPSCDPWEEVCTLSMSPALGESIGVDLAAASTEDAGMPFYDGGMACGLSRYLVLGTFESADQLCVLPEQVDALEDIDVTRCGTCSTQLTGCWTSTVYFSLWGEPAGDFVGRALAAKTADGELYRIRVLHEDASTQPAHLTIEYEGVM